MIYEPLKDVELPKEEPEAPQDINEHFSDEAREDRMQNAMIELMSGSVARGRSLKYWENLKLKPMHIQMLIMKAAGYKNQQIAERMNLTQARVSVIVNHPDAAYFLSHLISYQAENLLDVKARIQAHAGEALDTALMLMRTGKDEVREKVAFKLLDRAGYGAVQKTEVSHKVEMPAAQAQVLNDALRESAEVEDADFEVLDGMGQAGVGIGTPEHVSEPPTGRQLVPAPLQGERSA